MSKRGEFHGENFIPFALVEFLFSCGYQWNNCLKDDKQSANDWVVA